MALRLWCIQSTHQTRSSSGQSFFRMIGPRVIVSLGVPFRGLLCVQNPLRLKYLSLLKLVARSRPLDLTLAADPQAQRK